MTGEIALKICFDKFTAGRPEFLGTQTGTLLLKQEIL